jgi:hypothetical protein
MEGKTVAEIAQLKAECERAIGVLLMRFQGNTGMFIDGIRLTPRFVLDGTNMPVGWVVDSSLSTRLGGTFVSRFDSKT